MMNLALTRRPMHPRLQAILDPARLLPTEAETQRNTYEAAIRIGLEASRAKRIKAGLPVKARASQKWATFAVAGQHARGPGRPRGSCKSALSEEQQRRIVEIFAEGQWPSLGWIGKQVGATKGQVDNVLERARLRTPAPGCRAGQLEQFERVKRLRPAGHLTRAEICERTGATMAAVNVMLSRRKVAALKIGTLGFYAEDKLRAAGILP